MASAGIGDHPSLNLTPEEKQLFTRLYKLADTKGDGIVTGEVAVSLFPKAKLSENTLGEIWAMADTENRGFLLQEDFAKAMRLIGHFQSRPGVPLSAELALRPCPSGYPKFEGINMGVGAEITPLNTGGAAFSDISSPAVSQPPVQPFGIQQTGIQPQNSGSVRVPPLTPDGVANYTRLFESAGVKPGGTLDGEKARQFFQRSGLPNMLLAQVWNLADTEQRSALSLSEFIIAMHLLASYRNGSLTQLPNTLPAGLIEAASRRPTQAQTVIPRQFSGQNTGRTSSPLARQAFGPPSGQVPVSDWVIGPQEKSGFDTLFTRLDTHNAGFITGAQAVDFFSQSELPQESLAAIWDLATIRGQDQLNRDEFAVAMYLIRDQRGKAKPDLPPRLPQNLIPPSLRGQVKPSIAPQSGFAPPPAQPQKPPSAAEDLFGLDALSASPTQPAQPVQQQTTGGSGSFARPFDDPFSTSKSASSPTAHTFASSSPRAATGTSHFKPFVPTSSFGQGLATQTTGGSGTSSQAPQSTGGFPSARGQTQQASAMDDLLGDNDESSKKIDSGATELANMSNQLGILRNQMADVTAKKSQTEQELQRENGQKRDLELRLSQFRTQYEQEARAVKELEEQLNTSRKETRRIQQDLAMLEAGYQDLQGQHRNAAAALENERRENAALKERMRLINAEVANLKPQLEQMQKEAKIEKGRVSINKKQVEASEGQRDSMKREMDALARQQSEARNVPLPESSAVTSPALSTASAGGKGNPFFRKSPQPSFDSNMSPGAFGGQPATVSRGAVSGAGQQGKDSPNITNIFGPSFGVTPVTSPPATSFRPQETSPFPPAEPSVTSSEGPGLPTPSASPHPSEALPPPPASRQITSNDLPLPGGARPDTAASSVRVETPASRVSGMETPTQGSASPALAERPTFGGRTDTQGSTGAGLFDRAASPVASVTSNASRGAPAQKNAGGDFFSSFGGGSVSQGIPGAFPDPTPLEQTKTGGSAFSDQSQSQQKGSTPFGFPSTAGSRPETSASKSDFDSAFASKGVERQVTGTSVGSGSGAAGKKGFAEEFPPIQNVAEESESDSEGEQGFGDSFTQASPARGAAVGAPKEAMGGSSFFGGQPSSEPPKPEAQRSPPSYGTAAASTGRAGSGDFPAEFGGLLPSRENPLSSSQQEAQSPSVASGSRGDALFGSGGGASKSASSAPTNTFSAFSGSPPPTTGTPASTTGTHSDAFHSAPTHPNTERDSASSHGQKAGGLSSGAGGFNDDFDDFDNLGEAKDGDDGEDDFFSSSGLGGGHHGQRSVEDEEWNPQFDSPVASKTGTLRSERTPTGLGSQSQNVSKSSGFDDFGDFGSGAFGKPLGSGIGGGISGGGSTTLGNSGVTDLSKPIHDDWEDMFSSIGGGSATGGDKLTGSGNKNTVNSGLGSSGFDENEPFGSSSATAANAPPSAPEVPYFPEAPEAPEAPMPPKLGRTITESSVHDVDDVKKLVKMGFPRPLAVGALEKYDYDFGKALEHLTGRA